MPRPKEAQSVYRKLARTPGDYATASVACAEDGAGIRMSVGACGPKPIRNGEAETELGDSLHDADAVRAFAGALVDLADPVDDVRGSSEYRLKLIPRMVTAAIKDLSGVA